MASFLPLPADTSLTVVCSAGIFTSIGPDGGGGGAGGGASAGAGAGAGAAAACLSSGTGVVDGAGFGDPPQAAATTRNKDRRCMGGRYHPRRGGSSRATTLARAEARGDKRRARARRVGRLA